MTDREPYRIISRGSAFGAEHRWPVTLQYGGIELAPIRTRHQAEWDRVRRANTSWLRPWEATLPPGAQPGPTSYPGLVRVLTRQAKEGRLLPWLIFLSAPNSRQTPQLAGQLTVSGIVGGSAAWAQVGYWVDQRVAGRGIVPTAVALAVDYCFDVLRLHRIEIAIRPENVKSLRVVTKLGFRPEGLRPRYLHIDGDWRDHLVFALSAEEVPGGLLRRWLHLRPGGP
ncbi:MAG: GNAT family N-acetyltransferase [Microlunatus sp.]|nr:GNAT family N-acetyltransferase [Microlunatus sp.]MDN5771274.1 GNAT family N-acetyltransferase [Microlunatus sp.]MDN5805443.1 GNAT family N-acetyltransferase [Microlunatus sp.]